MSSVLELKNISKSFKQGKDKVKVLDSINLKIESSQVVALVGPSGSGKTTFMQIAGLLDKPESGEVLIEGESLSSANDNKLTIARRETLGFIYQFHNLLPEFTALENVVLPQLINNIDSKTANKNAKIALEKIGLKNRLNNFPGELSGGEQQRVAVVRSLINNPKLVLADEPTGNLDKDNADQVSDLLIKSIKEKESSSIIVTHNIELAKKADIIITIENGKLKYL